MTGTHKNLGGSFNDFLKEEGILEECTETAIKRVLAWQIEQEMKKNNLSKSAMARKMKTSRSSLDIRSGIMQFRSYVPHSTHKTRSRHGQEQKKRNGGIRDAQKKTYRPGL